MGAGHPGAGNVGCHQPGQGCAGNVSGKNRQIVQEQVLSRGKGSIKTTTVIITDALNDQIKLDVFEPAHRLVLLHITICT